MTQLNESLIAVKVPSDAEDYRLLDSIEEVELFFVKKDSKEIGCEFLSNESYTILGEVTKDEVRFNSEPHVKCLAHISKDVKFFQNYKYKLPQNVSCTFTNAYESFRSLLSSKGIEVTENNKFLILKIN